MSYKHSKGKQWLLHFVSRFYYFFRMKTKILLTISLLVICNLIFSQDTVKHRPKVGLVLSGGGAKGFAHIGVLKVLEEAGIPIDYIGGTSMGSIIGSMYAIGYDAKTLEKAVVQLDWDELLSDHTSHRSLSMLEKEQDSRYFLSFPIHGRKIELPEGIMSGHSIYKYFTRLTWNVHNVRDFSQFHIPFLCVASDIETGQSVTLQHGNLPDALRASMAIPSAFTPVELDGKLLVDGGLVNNLPVEEVLKMGADIIIAVDVQEPFYRKDDLTSITKILQQAGKFLRAPANIRNRQLANILITPQMDGFSVSSFTHSDSIIKRGELAARDILPKIKELIKFSNTTSTQKILSVSTIDNDTIFITDLKIIGLKKVSNGLVIGKLKFEVPAKVTFKALEEGLDRVYGSQYFERISYMLEPYNSGNRLVITVSEQKAIMFRVGLHYDNDYNAAILLNTTIRNFYKNGSTLLLDARLSENPKLSASFFIDKGWMPSPWLFVQFNNSEVVQDSIGKRIASFNYSEGLLSIGTQSFPSNAVGMGGAIQAEISSIRSKISPIDFQNVDYRFLNYFGYFKFDYLDRTIYPRSGLQFYAEGKLLTQIDDYDDRKKMSPAFVGQFRYNQAIKFSSRFSLIAQISAGASAGNSLPLPYRFYMGGIGNNYTKGVMPFVGMRMMEKTGNNIIINRLDAQFEFRNDQYFILKTNIGKISNQFKDLFHFEDITQGVGLTYGYNTVIGPLEFTLMSSNSASKLLAYINVGFWF